MKRITRIAVPLMLLACAMSCGGNSTLDNTEAVVFLSVDIDTYDPDIAICGRTFDIDIESMTITSIPKDPNANLSANQDVRLTRWVVTPVRADGGTTASPVWSHDVNVYVPADGTASLENYRVYGWEYFDDPPLSFLLNGGFDPETGNENIRQTLNLQIFGRTVSGKAISTPVVPIAFNFTCE